MQQALQKSIKNRRGSINVVPFESALLYGQPTESMDQNTDQPTSDKRSVSKSRRYKIESHPNNHTASQKYIFNL